jgi:hypothetical protein
MNMGLPAYSVPGGWLMILWGSLTITVLLTGFVMYYCYIRRNHLSAMTGMVVCMANSMLASIMLGTVLGMTDPNRDLTLPTILAVSFGMIAGYLTGRPISLVVSLEGMTAGIMGGMMGAMLGVMTQPSTSQLMLFFLDLIYLVVSIVLIRIIEEETFKRSRLILWVTIIIFIYIVYVNLHIFLN